jgi:hypothetical protein
MPDEINNNDGLSDDSLEIFEFMDPVTRKTVDLPKTIDGVDLKSLLGHVISSHRNETKKKIAKLESDVENYRVKAEELESELQEISDKNMTDDDKRKREEDKLTRQLQELESRADNNWNLFKQNQIENDLYKAMAGHDLCNAQQTMMLLKSLGSPDIVDEEGRYKTVLKMTLPDESGEITEQELEPAEAFKKWISLEENRHLLKNNLRAGGGSNNVRTGGDSQPITSFTREDLANNPEARKALLQRIKKGESLNIET